MAATHQSGPHLSYGYNPTAGGDYNPDAGPDVSYQGAGIIDPRYPYGGGAYQVNVNPPAGTQWVTLLETPYIAVVDAVPSTAAAANIAALQTPTQNTAMTLVAASGSGVTVSTAAAVVAGYPMAGSAPGIKALAGSTALLALDGLFAYKSVGPQAILDPTVALARCVSLTSSGNASAVNFTVVGYDLFGYRMTQTLAGPNGNTVNTTKAFKYVLSVTPNGNSGATVSVGTADIFGLHVRSTKWEYTDIYFNGILITSSTGWTTADQTNPASATTGDVRGTYAVQSASNGVKRLVMFQSVSTADAVAATPQNFVSLFGQAQA